MNPYLVLGVNLEADDQAIRHAYLDALKQSPPDTHPAQFQAINQAYEKIKDQTRRHNYHLFNQECPGASPLDALLRCVRLQGRPRPLPMDYLKKYLRQSLSK